MKRVHNRVARTPSTSCDLRNVCHPPTLRWLPCACRMHAGASARPSLPIPPPSPLTIKEIKRYPKKPLFPPPPAPNHPLVTNHTHQNETHPTLPVPGNTCQSASAALLPQSPSSKQPNKMRQGQRGSTKHRYASSSLAVRRSNTALLPTRRAAQLELCTARRTSPPPVRAGGLAIRNRPQHRRTALQQQAQPGHRQHYSTASALRTVPSPDKQQQQQQLLQHASAPAAIPPTVRSPRKALCRRTLPTLHVTHGPHHSKLYCRPAFIQRSRPQAPRIQAALQLPVLRSHRPHPGKHTREGCFRLAVQVRSPDSPAAHTPAVPC